MNTFSELMKQVNATDDERLFCAIKLAKMRSEKTIKTLVDLRKVSPEMLIKAFTI